MYNTNTYVFTNNNRELIIIANKKQKNGVLYGMYIFSPVFDYYYVFSIFNYKNI